jgi:hypothetical protein
MGVFLDDGYTVRHSTVSQSWAVAGKHMTGGIFGQKAPIDGFTPDSVRYGWPGTITQTVDDAFNRKPGTVTYMDPDGDKWDITELSFSVVAPVTGGLIPPVVVRPCHETTDIRDVLSVVGAAVEATNGHYRFYAYTDATIALDAARAGPPQSVRRQDEGGAWVEQNVGALVDPANPCDRTRAPITETIPVVCSSLPWAAVQLVNRGDIRGRGTRDFGRHYRVILDTGVSGKDRCPQVASGAPAGHIPDPLNNGLIVYDEAQRVRAGNVFYKLISDEVSQQAAEALPSWLSTAGYVAIGVGVLLLAFTGGGSAVLIAAGLSATDADKLLLAITNMQDHVANQLANAFATDDAGSLADGWRHPGTGRAVGPDDTAWYWSPDQGIDPDGTVHGLYGSNVPLALRFNEWVEEVECVWRECELNGSVTGTVRRDNGSGLEPVSGAKVEFACLTFTTDGSGSFFQEGDVPTGIYLVRASYTDPVTGYVWETAANQADVQINPGSLAHLELVLVPPPAAKRKIDITGTIDIVDRVAIGHDGWQHGRLGGGVTAFVGPYSELNPDPSKRDEGKVWKGHLDGGGSAGGEETCEVEVTITWQTNLSVEVSIAARLKDGSDIDDTHNETKTIAQDATDSFVFQLSSGEAWPDRGWVSLTFHNDRQH